MSKWINVWHEVNFHTSTGKLTHSGRHSSEHKPRLRFLCSMAPSPEIGPSLCGFNWVVGSFTGCTDTDLYSNMHSCASLQPFPALAYSSISAQAQSGRSYCPGPASNPQRRGWVTDRVIPKPRMEATNFFPISSRSQLGLLGVEWRGPGYRAAQEWVKPTSPCLLPRIAGLAQCGSGYPLLGPWMSLKRPGEKGKL